MVCGCACHVYQPVIVKSSLVVTRNSDQYIVLPVGSTTQTAEWL
jgi:hypothetical protein